MAPANRIIIDTDPGVDDVLAMLLAFAALRSELQVLLIAVTYGNTDVQNCLRNVISLFYIIEKEREWRRTSGRPEGFEALAATRPIVAVGPEGPLLEQTVKADFFHGIDGLGGIHTSHPHLNPPETWQAMFKVDAVHGSPSETVKSGDIAVSTLEHGSFTPSSTPAHKEILRILAENPPGTITIVAIGPMTNVALAAAEDVETFLRVKEVVVMGGAVDVPGNISPMAEFNSHSDPTAFARILALTSPTPSSTMPPAPDTSLLPDRTASGAQQRGQPTNLAPYPSPLPSRLKLTLFPLDITRPHTLRESSFSARTAAHKARGSPLAEWTAAFLEPVFARSRALGLDGLSMHDPLCVWYAMTRESAGVGGRAAGAGAGAGAEGAGPDTAGAGAAGAQGSGQGWELIRDEDLRVETLGQWTRGACVVDRRGRRKRAQGEDKVPGDHQGWLSAELGNRVDRVVRSPVVRGKPGAEAFEGWFLDRVFGVAE